MGTQVKVSKRLEKIAQQIHKGSFFADIGSDHAYLPCHVCMEDVDARAVVGEVQKGPFDNAMRTVKKYGLTEQISVRLGDGLQVIEDEDEIDTITIAGMGGQLIVDILQANEAKLLTVDTIIAQPNTNAHLVRQYLHHIDFHLKNEFLLEENDVIYDILVASQSAAYPYDVLQQLRDKQFLFGPYLMREKPSLFLQKWKQEYHYLAQVQRQVKEAKQVDKIKLNEIEIQLGRIKEVLS